MNRIVLIILLVFITLTPVMATTYYVAATGSSSNNGTSQATPWSFSNLSTKTLAAGDNILLHRGDIFTGTWTTVNSASSGNPIIVDGYGTGPNPVITGLTTVTSWTAVTGSPGVYKSQALNPQTNIIRYVCLDGAAMGKGRYPNADATNGGYLMYEGNSNSTPSITDNDLSTTIIDASWVGCTVGMRCGDYKLESGAVTAINVSTGVITYNNSTMGTQPTGPGYGYFMTNSLKTLDQLGEWWYNTGDKCVYMYFGTVDPDMHLVQATTTDILLNAKNSYYTFKHIDFLGANMYLMESISGNTTDLKFIACNFKHCGNTGLLWQGRLNPLIDSCVIQYCNSNGINAGYGCSNMIVRNSTFQDIGCQAANYYTDMTYQMRTGFGIFASNGANGGISMLTAINNRFINIGYTGIYFDGSNNFIYKNYVNHTTFIIDDVGGIYTVNDFVKNGTPQRNNIIRRNIVLNSIGAPLGKPTAHGNMGSGIYLDDNSNHCTVDSNFISYAGLYGIYIHNSDSDRFERNKIMGGANSQIGLQDDGIGRSIKNDTIRYNVLFSTASSQKTYYFAADGSNSTVNTTNLRNFGIVNNNQVCNPFNESGNIAEWNLFSVSTNNYTFTSWKSNSGYDAVSTQTPLTISSMSRVIPLYADQGDRSFSFFGSYKKMDGTSVTSILSLPDHTGEIIAH